MDSAHQACSLALLHGERHGEPDTAISLVVDAGRVTHLYIHRNPHKLTRLDEPARLSR